MKWPDLVRAIYARIGGVNGIWTDFHSPDLADFETSEFAKFEDFSGNLVDFADMKTLKVCEFLRAESDQTLADSQTLKVCEFLSAESEQTLADSQTFKVCEFLRAESDQTLADSQTLKVCEVLRAESDQTLADSQTLKSAKFSRLRATRLCQTRRLESLRSSQG